MTTTFVPAGLTPKVERAGAGFVVGLAGFVVLADESERVGGPPKMELASLLLLLQLLLLLLLLQLIISLSDPTDKSVAALLVAK